MLKLAVLLSGSGRTLDNFHDRIAEGSLNASVEVVISNVADALGLQKAGNYGYPAFHAQGNQAINAIIKEYDIDLVCLAGYLKLYEPPPELARAVLNIHPALIPAFSYDEGPIVVQKCVALDDSDTPDDIAAKVFAKECEAFPEAINLVAAKGIDYFWRQS
jgi:phosphoribosylglycinamide formyltransferase-1